MTLVLSTPWSVCKCSPSWCCAGRCCLKSQSSNPALLQLLKAEMGRQNCVVAQWIQKLFGFHASAAVVAVKATVPRAISTTVGDNWGSCSWSGYSKRKRDLQTQSFKTPAFVKILVTLYTTLQVLANSYTGTLSLSCSSVSLWVPVMWIQSFSWTLKNRQLWNKNTSASAGGGWSDRNINYAWMHNKIIFRKWENHLGMKKMGFFSSLWYCEIVVDVDQIHFSVMLMQMNRNDVYLQWSVNLHQCNRSPGLSQTPAGRWFWPAV